MKTAAWLIFWAIVALIGTHHLRRRAPLNTSTDHQSWQHAEERSRLEQELRRLARDAEAKRNRALENALGGPTAAAFKNPNLSLLEALQRAAYACAPTNTLVRADVDRFTEFTVTYECGAAIVTNEVVATLRNLIPVAGKYLDAVRFSAQGRLVAEIDRSDIEFIDDWTQASDQTIAALLPRETQSRIAEDAAAIQRLRDEQRISEAIAAEPALRDKVSEADRKFRQSTQGAYAELVRAVESLRNAMALNQVRSFRQLDDRDRDLQTAVEQAAHAEKFWTNPAAAWGQTLEAEGVFGDLRDLLTKNFPSMFRSDTARATKVFEVLRGQIETARYILRMLGNDNDKWRFTSEGIAFRDEEFTRRFENAQRQFREDALATEEALRAWRDAVGP